MPFLATKSNVASTLFLVWTGLNTASTLVEIGPWVRAPLMTIGQWCNNVSTYGMRQNDLYFTIGCDYFSYYILRRTATARTVLSCHVISINRFEVQGRQHASRYCGRYDSDSFMWLMVRYKCFIYLLKRDKQVRQITLPRHCPVYLCCFALRHPGSSQPSLCVVCLPIYGLFW